MADDGHSLSHPMGEGQGEGPYQPHNSLRINHLRKITCAPQPLELFSKKRFTFRPFWGIFAQKSELVETFWVRRRKKCRKKLKKTVDIGFDF
jgi:hypothetical protein